MGSVHIVITDIQMALSLDLNMSKYCVRKVNIYKKTLFITQHTPCRAGADPGFDEGGLGPLKCDFQRFQGQFEVA